VQEELAQALEELARVQAEEAHASWPPFRRDEEPEEEVPQQVQEELAQAQAEGVHAS
jgi:hypothetical protein